MRAPWAFLFEQAGHIPTSLAIPLLAVSTLVACNKSEESQPVAPAAEKAPPVAPATEEEPVKEEPLAKRNAEQVEASPAKVGEPAPEFSLPDLEGNQVKLSDSRGKIVVLEWFNPECPFVKASHTKGSLVTTADLLMKKGVVYLAINSGAPGKQGHGKEVNAQGKETFKLSHPILLDEAGFVGKTYGATNTPHIFVIDEKGTLAYRGAIDNSKDGEGQSPEGGTLVNYLTQAVDELLAKKPVSTPETKAYGCSVKYGS